MSTSAIDTTGETRKPISLRAYRNARDWCQKSANTEYDVNDGLGQYVRMVCKGAFGHRMRGSTKAEAQARLEKQVASSLTWVRRDSRSWYAQQIVQKALDERYTVIVPHGNSRGQQWKLKITENGRQYLATVTKQNDPSTPGAERHTRQGEILA